MRVLNNWVVAASHLALILAFSCLLSMSAAPVIEKNVDFTNEGSRQSNLLSRQRRAECGTAVCLNGGRCNGTECICPKPYSGSQCNITDDYCTDLQPDKGIISLPVCLNGGNCSSKLEDPYFECSCLANSTGVRCEHNSCSFHNPCLNGDCVDTTRGTSCSCHLGWSGSNCSISIGVCRPGSCLNGGRCIDGVANFTCQCLEGYSGRDCSIDYPDCSPNPCGKDSVCLERSNQTLYGIAVLPPPFDGAFDYSLAAGYVCHRDSAHEVQHLKSTAIGFGVTGLIGWIIFLVLLSVLLIAWRKGKISFLFGDTVHTRNKILSSFSPNQTDHYVDSMYIQRSIDRTTERPVSQPQTYQNESQEPPIELQSEPGSPDAVSECSGQIYAVADRNLEPTDGTGESPQREASAPVSTEAQKTRNQVAIGDNKSADSDDSSSTVGGGGGGAGPLKKLRQIFKTTPGRAATGEEAGPSSEVANLTDSKTSKPDENDEVYVVPDVNRLQPTEPALPTVPETKTGMKKTAEKKISKGQKTKESKLRKLFKTTPPSSSAASASLGDSGAGTPSSSTADASGLQNKHEQFQKPDESSCEADRESLYLHPDCPQNPGGQNLATPTAQPSIILLKNPTGESLTQPPAQKPNKAPKPAPMPKPRQRVETLQLQQQQQQEKPPALPSRPEMRNDRNQLPDPGGATAPEGEQVYDDIENAQTSSNLSSSTNQSQQQPELQEPKQSAPKFVDTNDPNKIARF